MTRSGRNLLCLVVFLLAAGLLSCQSESGFAPIPVDNAGTTVLAGTVTSATGPLANAIVTLEPLVAGLPIRVHAAVSGSESLVPLGGGFDTQSPGVRATVTDALGRFAFTGVAPGGFQLDARGRDHLGATQRVTIGPIGALAETTLVDIRLTPTGDYYGTVTLETLSSHQGTLVYIDGTSHVAATKPSGGYVIEGVPVGSHTVRATHPGWLDRTAMGTIAAAGDSIPLATLVLPRDSNIAPIAVANAPTNTFVGQSVSFTGSATDDDGTIVRYEWDFEDDGTFDYSNPGTAATTHVFATAGNYLARLRVLDDDAAIGVDVVSFTVLDNIYVATTGSDANPGTPSQPVLTIARALLLAQPTGQDITVAGGIYNASVTLVSNVSIFGGYDPITWLHDPANQTTRIIGTTKGVQGTSVTNVDLVGLTIESINAVAAGESSYGLYLVSCQTMSVRNCRIVGGRGANGTAGPAGNLGSIGGNGGQGNAGCENAGFPCTTCSQPSPGLRGSGVFQGGLGGLPGLGPQNGSPGANGSGPGPGLGGPGAACNPSCNGTNGQAGQPGTAGTDGTAGVNFGTAAAGGYVISSGGNGANGVSGSGGGGGGGGSGGTAGCDSYGSSGGGGGGGGGAGTLGTGGTGGGGSFAIWLRSCTGVAVTNCLLETVGGGTGGNGGSGGNGGTGGFGGPGGPYGGGSSQDDGGNGASGGAGGLGGRGGHGGGGGGGPSIGILVSATTGFTVSGSTYTLGNGGTGGSSSAAPGATGVKQSVYP